MQDLAPCPTTFHNLWKSLGIFGTLQKLSLSLQHMHISTFGKFGRFNLDLQEKLPKEFRLDDII